ncbi:uncharacterized protein DUF4185 [Kribbella sp. VKM Ac-2568]|nr:uncharacterized protein DUF4185 [Kribbella sp. VKM Ac-2568]
MPPQPTLSRSTFLKAAVGAGALLAVPAAAEAATRGTQAVVTNKVADLTGPGLTNQFRMQATDLGFPVRTPDGRMLFMFGDTFENPVVGGGWWRSPVALWSTTTNLAGGVKWSGAVGGAAAQQLWDYPHDNPTFSTVLPSDVITFGGSMYLHAMVNKGLGNVVWTEIWRSDNSGASWYHTGAKFPSDIDGGLFQLLTWGEGNDGYVYVYSTGFQRNKPTS